MNSQLMRRALEYASGFGLRVISHSENMDLADGTLDAIATDHAPHSVMEKEVEFDRAANGIIGLETALPLSLQLVADGVLDLNTLI